MPQSPLECLISRKSCPFAENVFYHNIIKYLLLRFFDQISRITFSSRKSQFNLVLLAAILLSFNLTSMAVEETDFVDPPNYPMVATLRSVLEAVGNFLMSGSDFCSYDSAY